ncbi:hypothetical protein RhiJN_17650 [Ceratobasidium sp. AG-Ba]|nr:hypothetical protein RhiJN_17650 [Ceratobasidium sp. AG-Ba]
MRFADVFEDSANNDDTLSTYPSANQRISYNLAAYNITIVSANGTSIQNAQLPDIWLSNAADTFRRRPPANAKSDAKFMNKFPPWLVTPWKLSPGSAVQASIGLITRRFIVSSVLRDTVVNLNPLYESTSLFPIANVASTPLPDNRVASAMLSASFQTSPAYLTSRGVVETDSDILSSGDTCTIIEDYRSSTTFDALGSIGGLLAILQGLHILLFGRPMFWGIAGAKLISPFGLFGRCRSRDFGRKLRENYHYKPQDTTNQDVSAKDIAETIRIAAFLRDFVIDFGPTDIESGPEAQK